MKHENLKTCLRSALAGRRPLDLRRLLDRHGARAFSAVLAAWSPRAVADVLSLLPFGQRTAVVRHLPWSLRHDDLSIQSLQRHGIGEAMTPHAHRSYPTPLPTITRMAP